MVDVTKMSKEELVETIKAASLEFLKRNIGHRVPEIHAIQKLDSLEQENWESAIHGKCVRVHITGRDMEGRVVRTATDDQEVTSLLYLE